MHQLISFYEKVNHVRSKEVIPFDIFIENIRSGHWQDIVLPIRTIEDKAARDEAKVATAPSVTVSGKFSERYDDKLDKHSGLIQIDIDEVPPEPTKKKLSQDKYLLCAFTSISGRGICCIFKINPDKHREAFQGLGEYLYNAYEIIIDPTSINPSRARFVSYDPHLLLNERAEKFTLYPKAKPPKKVDKVIYSKDDFGELLKQIVERRLNLVENYHEWLRICFALVEKFGEQGREYFHIISQYSAKYEPKVADKQFDACLKQSGKNAGKQPSSIKTLYYYAKLAGLELYSARTKLIAQTTINNKKAGLDKAAIAETLAQFEGITDAEDIIAQVFDNDIELNEDTLINQVEVWIKQNYTLRRNAITRYIENNGVMISQAELNSIYIRAKKVFEKLTYDLLDRLINSDFVPTYNPFTEYFATFEAQPITIDPALTPWQTLEAIKAACPLITGLFGSITTPDPDYCLYFGCKWLVGAISSVQGKHSPLMFVLSGAEQNTGKTEWFRKLLPEALHKEGRTYPNYYAESKLDAGKDDEILMTQKLLIMDDEMGGKSKKEVKRLKELTSKQTFSLREPYGRNNVDLQRVAALCGTTNDNEILSDPTGNRRIIPIHVTAINHGAYNAINKDDLWREVYALYIGGFRWQMNKVDIDYLGADTNAFEVTVLEAELLTRYFEPGKEELTATDIKVILEAKTAQRLSLDKIGKELKRRGFTQAVKRVGNGTKRVYLVAELAAPPIGISEEDLPF